MVLYAVTLMASEGVVHASTTAVYVTLSQQNRPPDVPAVFVPQPCPSQPTIMKPFRKLPLDVSPRDEWGYDVFQEQVWHNGEVCNSCFAQVRTIGPELKRELKTSKHRPLKYGPALVLAINEWYDRTENGSQEHTTWDHNERFGTCYCLNCGTDCNGNHRNKSLEDLKPLVKNIYIYTKKHTQYDIDGKRFVSEVKNLKGQRSAQGHETEVMALAFSRALKRPSRSTTPTQATAD